MEAEDFRRKVVPDYSFIDVSKLLHCGVYCLLQKGVVVYVGKSKQPLTRLDGHMRNRGHEMPNGHRYGSGGSGGPTYNGRGIKFDGIRFYPCMLGQLDVIEMQLIKKYLPKYNTKGMPPQPIPPELKNLLALAGWMTNPDPEPTAPRGPYIMRRL